MWLWRDTAQSHCPRPGSSWPGWSRTRTLPTWGSFTVQLGTTSRTGSPEKVTPYSVLPNWSVLIEGYVFVFMVYSVFTVYEGSFVYLSVDQPHGEPHVSLPDGVGGVAPVLLHTGAPRHGGAGGQWPQTGNLLLLQHPGWEYVQWQTKLYAGYSIEYCIYSWSLKFRIYRCWFFFLQFFVQNKRTLVSFIELPALVSTLCLTIIVRIWACCSLGWLITPDIYLYRWIYLAGAWLPAWLRPALCAGSYWGTWLGSTPGSPPCCMHHPGVRRDPPSKVRPHCRCPAFFV